MACGKCGKCKKLGPISLGLGLGITAALAVLLESVWTMYHGLSPVMVQLNLPVPTWNEAMMHSLEVLWKGFLFGFFLALIYDLFACLFSMCCRRSNKCHCCGAPGKCSCCGASVADKTEPGK